MFSINRNVRIQKRGTRVFVEAKYYPDNGTVGIISRMAPTFHSGQLGVLDDGDVVTHRSGLSTLIPFPPATLRPVRPLPPTLAIAVLHAECILCTFGAVHVNDILQSDSSLLVFSILFIVAYLIVSLKSWW